MYFSKQRRGRGLGTPYWELPGWETRGYIGDQNRMLAARDAARGYLPFVPAPAPAPTVAAAGPVVGPARSVAAAVRQPVTVSVRRAVLVPKFGKGPRGVGAFYLLPARAGLGSVSTFFQNNTHPGVAFAAGDTWQMTLTGAPNSPVYISGTHNGQDMGKTPFGTTDASGRIVLNGTMTANEVGQWTETFWIGSEASSPVSFEVVARSPALGESLTAYLPSSASGASPILTYTPESTMSSVPGMSNPVQVPTLRAHLSSLVSGNERDYLLTGGSLPTPDGCAAWLQEMARQFCQMYPDACTGTDQASLISSLCSQYQTWYLATLSAYYNIQDRTGGTPASTAPPRPAGYVYPTVFTSGPGYVAQQSGATPQQALVASIGPAAAAAAQGSGSSGAVAVNSTQTNPAASGGGGGAAAAGGGSTPAASGGASDFLSGSVSIFGFDIPMWAAGAGVVGALWMFGGGRR